MSTLLDQYIHRFQNMPPWNIHTVLPDGLSAIPWMDVDGQAIATELILDELHTMPQVDTISADIQKWGRLESHARRVWEMAERELRRWKSQFMVNAYESEEKSPPKHILEAKYRIHKDYHRLSAEAERAEEAYNATHMVLEGFRAKKDMLARFAKRYRDG